MRGKTNHLLIQSMLCCATIFRVEGAIPSNNLETSITGYQSLPELWQDFAPIILQVIHLKNPPPVQRLLNYTGDFHEFCGSFQQDTDEYEYKEYFEAMDYAWCRLLDLPTSQTDKVRIINILRDGQDKVARMGLHFEVYPHALDKAEEEEQQAEEGD